MNPDRAALMAGPPLHQSNQRPAMANNSKPPVSQWNKKPGEKVTKPLSRSGKKKSGVKVKKKWTAEKPTNKRAQRAGPRSLAKQGLRVRLPKTAEQKAKAQARKEFRNKQQAGAALRKEIKTARREGYRVVKRTARPMKEYQARYRLAIIAVEQEATKQIHNEVDEWERTNAMAFCDALGFTIENTEGTSEIKPRVLGMKGKELDLDNLEIELQAAEEKLKKEKEDKLKYGDHRGGRIDLGKVPDEAKTVLITSGGENEPGGMDGDFVSFDTGEDDDQPVAPDDINYNHKMRRKLNRAIRTAQIKKENVVRARTLEYCKENGFEPYPGFTASHKPARLDNHRMLIDGSLETAKQERIRRRVEVAQFNELARAFRKIAKAAQQEAAAKAEQEILDRLKAERLSKGLPTDDLEDAKPWAEHFSEKSRRVQREKRKQEALSGKKKRSGSDSSSDGDSSDSDSSDSDSSGEPGEPKSASSKKRPRRDSEGDASQEKKKAKLSKEQPSEENSDSFDHSAAAPTPTESKAEKKKSKKGSSDQSANASNVTESKVEKTKSKKSVRIAESPEVVKEDAPEVVEENKTEEKLVQKEKKVKKEKKAKKAKKEKTDPPATQEPETTVGNDWNADALDGDAARKDKFLRLLGGMKDTTSSKPKSKSSHNTTDITRVQTDLEKQFQQGIELKHGNAGKRRGIGA